jgi:hypothetical protein
VFFHIKEDARTGAIQVTDSNSDDEDYQGGFTIFFNHIGKHIGLNFFLRTN